MHAGQAIQPNFYTSHRVQHFKDLYPFVHKYHHVGHPTTPWEAQEGGESKYHNTVPLHNATPQHVTAVTPCAACRVETRLVRTTGLTSGCASPLTAAAADQA